MESMYLKKSQRTLPNETLGKYAYVRVASFVDSFCPLEKVELVLNKKVLVTNSTYKLRYVGIGL